ncbi:hypothetical protein SAMN05216489_00651 [Streptomyces sp. 3213]|nr:hypothetical protein SAMN05216489_00651 [Streptomyces sp. 3213] [Streptomyces sp. 3213.3]
MLSDACAALPQGGFVCAGGGVARLPRRSPSCGARSSGCLLAPAGRGALRSAAGSARTGGRGYPGRCCVRRHGGVAGRPRAGCAGIGQPPGAPPRPGRGQDVSARGIHGDADATHIPAPGTDGCAETPAAHRRGRGRPDAPGRRTVRRRQPGESCGRCRRGRRAWYGRPADAAPRSRCAAPLSAHRRALSAGRPPVCPCHDGRRPAVGGRNARTVVQISALRMSTRLGS